MTLEQLKIFVEAARYGSFTLAAGRLGLTQSAISISIRKLEERHGVTLFDRVNNGLSITVAGKILLTEAERILSDIDLTIKRVESYRDASNIRTVIACSRNAYDQWVPFILSRMLREGSTQKFEVVQGSSEDVAAWVMRGTANIGITESPPGHPQFQYLEVFSDEFILCATADRAAALRAPLDWSDLEDIGPVLWEMNTDLEHFIVDALRMRKVHDKRLLHEQFRLNSTAAVLCAVESGSFPGFITESIGRVRIEAGQLVKLGDFSIPIKYWLFESRQRESTALAKAFGRAASGLTEADEEV
jgi:DNA-binding transcriptional LysR family regulator